VRILTFKYWKTLLRMSVDEKKLKKNIFSRERFRRFSWRSASLLIGVWDARGWAQGTVPISCANYCVLSATYDAGDAYNRGIRRARHASRPRSYPLINTRGCIWYSLNIRVRSSLIREIKFRATKWRRVIIFSLHKYKYFRLLKILFFSVSRS